MKNWNINADYVADQATVCRRLTELDRIDRLERATEQASKRQIILEAREIAQLKQVTHDDIH